MLVVQAQRIACLAWQSDLALVLQIQQTLLPRYIRQRSRLIINKQYKQSLSYTSNHLNITIINITIGYCTHQTTQFGFQKVELNII